MNHLPLILVEVVLVFGGALAFAWWQFRDLRREREKRERKQREASGDAA
jgi:cytoskeletal protein RodZ